MDIKLANFCLRSTGRQAKKGAKLTGEQPNCVKNRHIVQAETPISEQAPQRITVHDCESVNGRHRATTIVSNITNPRRQTRHKK